MQALIAALRAPRLAALIEALRPRDSVLLRALLRSGQKARIGRMEFAGEFTQEEFDDLSASAPHHHIYRVAPGLFSQEVR